MPAACVLGTITDAPPLTPPVLAAMKPLPPLLSLGAVYKPVLLRLPIPVSDQVKDGCVLRGFLNWSWAIAQNCCLLRWLRVTLVGDTATLVSVWLTLMVSLLVAVKPDASVMVTLKV